MIVGLLCLLALSAWGNDGVFYVQGNQLVPIHETDISVAKEVLTISIGDDGFASVDVQYEFMNHGPEKMVVMGFEADAPYNVPTMPALNGLHPYIKDFTVVMNDQPLGYSYGVVASGREGTDFKPLDLTRWKPRLGDDFVATNVLFYNQTDSCTDFAYAYYFNAKFRKGMNTVHHTYRYRMSFGVGRTFEIPYWLKPAMRWKNQRIDDFTLCIKAENTAKHFCMEDSLFQQASFTIEGTGKMRHYTLPYGGPMLEVSLRNGALVWHGRNFVPREDICIYAADVLYAFTEEEVVGSFYDRNETFCLYTYEDTKENWRILRNLPFAHRGYVFKNKKLREYFSKLWWYMPDPTWKSSTDDFTLREWRLLVEHE